VLHLRKPKNILQPNRISTVEFTVVLQLNQGVPMAALYISHWCPFVSFGQAKEKKKEAKRQREV
jgi:hypothetical protein